MHWTSSLLEKQRTEHPHSLQSTPQVDGVFNRTLIKYMNDGSSFHNLSWWIKQTKTKNVHLIFDGNNVRWIRKIYGYKMMISNIKHCQFQEGMNIKIGADHAWFRHTHQRISKPTGKRGEEQEDDVHSITSCFGFFSSCYWIDVSRLGMCVWVCTVSCTRVVHMNLLILHTST